MQTENKPKLTFTSYQKFLMVILALLQFTIILDFMVISPLGDILIKDLGISTSQFGIVVSSYAFSAGGAGILAAGFADKFDRKKLLMFFYTGFILGTLICGLSNDYTLLLVARTVTGLFGGVIGSISLAIITDVFEVQQRGRVMGVVQMAFAVSQIMGIPIGIFLANHYGWHSTFLMIVILAIFILIAVFTKMQAINAHLKIQREQNAFQHLLNTIKNPRYQTGFMAIMFLAIGGYMLMPFTSTFLINNVGITKSELPLVFMFTGVSSMIVMPLIGRLSDKVDKFKIFLVGSILAVIMVNVYTHLPHVPLWEVIVVNVILFAGIMSRAIPVSSLNTSVPAAQDRGAFMSINSSLQQIAGGIGAVIAGFVVHQETKQSPIENFDLLGYVVSTIILLCIWFVFRVSKMVKASDAANNPGK